MVGKDEQVVLAVQARLHLADEGIQFPVPGFGDVEAVVIEHVLDTVEIVEDARQHAFLEFTEQVEEDLFTAFEDGIAQGEELIVSDAVLLQPGRVLWPAQREVGTDLLPERFRKGGRGGVMECGMQGMDL